MSLRNVKPISFPSTVPKKHALMKGSSGKNQYSCFLEAKNVLYIGVSSLPRQKLELGQPMYDAGNYDHPLFHIAASLLRHIYKKEMGADVRNYGDALGSIAPPLVFNSVADEKNQLRSIQFYSRVQGIGGMTGPTVSAGRWVISPSFFIDVSNPTKKFSEACWDLAQQMQHWYCKEYDQGSNSQNFERELYGYACMITEAMISINQGEHRPFRYTPIRRLDNRTIKVNVSTDIKIQPKWTTEAVSANDSYQRDAYFGKVYYFKDPYPIPDMDVNTYYLPMSSGLYDSAEQVGSLKYIMTDSNGDGIIRPNMQWNVELSHIPPAHYFKNCSREGKFLADSGDTRTMRMTFNFDGPINKFFRGYGFVNQSTANALSYTSNVGEMNGTCMLFCIQQHNPSGQYDATTGAPLSEYIWADLHVRRYTYAALGKEVRKGLDPIEYVSAAGAGGPVTEQAVPKDIVIP